MIGREGRLKNMVALLRDLCKFVVVVVMLLVCVRVSHITTFFEFCARTFFSVHKYHKNLTEKNLAQLEVI